MARFCTIRIKKENLHFYQENNSISDIKISTSTFSKFKNAILDYLDAINDKRFYDPSRSLYILKYKPLKLQRKVVICKLYTPKDLEKYVLLT